MLSHGNAWKFGAQLYCASCAPNMLLRGAQKVVLGNFWVPITVLEKTSGSQILIK